MSADQAIQAMDDALSMHLVGEPDKVVERATKACTVLMEIVKKRELFIRMGKATHLKIEAWLLLGHFYGVTVQTTSVCSVVDEMTGAAGYEATSEAVHMATGKIVGRAVARCLNNEENWNTRPKYEYEKGKPRKFLRDEQVASYQLESMAQTRANSKALSSALRWVVILGGGNVEGTPAEEMQGQQPREEAQQSASGKKISEGQRKRIFAIAKEVGYPYNDLPALFEKHGFKTAADVTADKYDALIADLQQGQAQAAP
jgi:hypothetical protein